MGCHTWCYYKVDISLEEARKIFIEKTEKFINIWKIKIETEDEPTKDFYTIEEMDHLLKVMERQLRMVKSGLCNVAVLNSFDNNIKYIKNKGLYKECEDFLNIFRISNYPTDKLFSKEECIQFIENNKDKVEIFDTTYKLLDEFWDKHPNGMIYFT